MADDKRVSQQDILPGVVKERHLDQAIQNTLSQVGVINDNSITTSKLANGSVTSAKLASNEAWKTPTLSGTWVNLGSGFSTAGYYKTNDSIVRLKGVIKSGTVGTSAFTLPVGYRPLETLVMVCDSSNAHGDIVINTNGTVVPTTGSAVWFSLDGLTFRAEQ